ncbi:hypothetical protein MASR2M54_21050 [Aliarcobacter cryaerophilus]
MINSSGKIRGGIQRAVKLTLQDRYSNENILIMIRYLKIFQALMKNLLQKIL